MTSAVTTITGRRGVPERVVLRRTEALAAPIEAVALCDEIGSAVARLGDAVTERCWQSVLDETIRIGGLVTAARIEFRRLAGAIERGHE